MMKEDRDILIAQRVTNLESYESVARNFGLTKQRLEQIIKKKFPHLIVLNRRQVMAKKRMKNTRWNKRDEKGCFCGKEK